MLAEAAVRCAARYDGTKRDDEGQLKRCDSRQDHGVAEGRKPDAKFPLWGSLAIPGGALWGTALGVVAGLFLGNVAIGALIGAGLGIGIGLTLFAAAIVVASHNI